MKLERYFSLLKFIKSREDDIGKLTMLIFLLFSIICLFLIANLPDFKPWGEILFLITLAGAMGRWWIFYCICIKMQNNPIDAATVPELRNKLLQLSLILSVTFSLIYSLIAIIIIGNFAITAKNPYMNFCIIFLCCISLTLLSLNIFCGNFYLNKNSYFKIKESNGKLSKKFDLSDLGSKNHQVPKFLENIITYFHQNYLNKNFQSKFIFSQKKILANILGLSLIRFAHGLNFIISFFIFALFIFLDNLLNQNSHVINIILIIYASCSFFLTSSIKKSLLKTKKEEFIIFLLPIRSSNKKYNLLLGKILISYFFTSLFFAFLFIFLTSGLVFLLNHENIFGVAWVLLFTPLFLGFILRDYSNLSVESKNETGLMLSLGIAFIFTLILNFATGEYLFWTQFIVLVSILPTLGWVFFRWKKMINGPLLLPVGYRS